MNLDQAISPSFSLSNVKFQYILRLGLIICSLQRFTTLIRKSKKNQQSIIYRIGKT